MCIIENIFSEKEFSLSPSSALRAASPLKGEAVKYVNLAQVTASPLRGEAARRADEGDKDINLEKNLTKCQFVGQALPDKISYVNNTLFRLRHPVLDYTGEHNIPITTNPYGF